jgi:toxin ParE1/3/4
MSKVWQIRLGHQDGQDFMDILSWTAKFFGKAQATSYSQTISQALQALKDGPEILGCKSRNDIEPGLRTLHVARLGRKGRHFVVFRVGGAHTIDILRLLHDSMDLPRHLQAANDSPDEKPAPVPL